MKSSFKSFILLIIIFSEKIATLQVIRKHKFDRGYELSESMTQNDQGYIPNVKDRLNYFWDGLKLGIIESFSEDIGNCLKNPPTQPKDPKDFPSTGFSAEKIDFSQEDIQNNFERARTSYWTKFYGIVTKMQTYVGSFKKINKKAPDGDSVVFVQALIKKTTSILGYR